MVHRYTGLDRMLERSDKLFDAFMTMTAAQTDDFVPYSDFDAPLDSSNPRDTSAAAIVASAALDLFDMTGTQKYLDAARNILLSLGSPDYLAEGTAYQPILRKGSGKWGDPEVGTSFGDFYYIEAMLRHRALFPAFEPPLPSGPADLSNISTRGLVGEGSSVMIAGFVIGGSSPSTTLLRGVGPGIASFGVGEVVGDPVILLFDGDGSAAPMAQNDDWGSSPNLEAIEEARISVGAFALEAGSTDAVLLMTLEPGRYTLKMQGKEPGTSKVGLVEVYQVPE